MISRFNAPVPGESLTRPPKQIPWERPPELTDKEEVAQFYLKKFSEPDRMAGVMDTLEFGFTVQKVVEGIMRVGVSKGLHTIDVGLLVAPVLHAYIVSVAKDLGIEYDDGFEDKKAKEKKRKEVEKLKAKLKLSKLKVDLPAIEDAMSEDNTLTPEMEEPEGEVPVESAGLIKRRK